MGENSNNIYNEITQGAIGKTTVKLAMPVLIGQIMFVLYSMADFYFISLIDKKSTALISAVGLVFPVYFLFIAMGLGLSAGVSSLVARSLGEKNKNSLEKTGDSGLFLSIVLLILTNVVFYIFGARLVELLAGTGVSKEAIANGCAYLYYIIPGMSFLLVFQVLAGILQGEGLMNYPSMAMLLSVVLNIILDPVFIFAFRMGISGAALATSLSIFTSVVFLMLIFTLNKSVIKIHFSIKMVSSREIREIVRVGAPQACNMFFLSIFFMVINYFIGCLGEDLLNSWSLVGRMDDFILMIGYALSGSTIALTGQNFGSSNIDRVKKSFQTNLIFALAGCVILAGIYNLFAYPLFRMLTDNSRVLEYAIRQVRFVSFSYTGIIASIILNALFVGTGKSLPGFALNLIRNYIILIPLCFVSVFLLNYGFNNILVIFVTINLLTLAASIIWAVIYLKNLKYKPVLNL